MSDTVAPDLDLCVPVYNEAHVIDDRIRTLHSELAAFPNRWRLTIVDNGSTDGTRLAAQRLVEELDGLRLLALDQKGRGRALRAAWLSSDASVVAYTDVDLSTGLTALSPLVTALLSGHSDLATGSRLVRGASVKRGMKREVLSRGYNLILRAVLGTRIRDAQCGFKAVRTEIARTLVPEVEDNSWFFDTELLIRAERHGLRVLELPVDWIDDTDSRVALLKTATDDLKGVLRLARELGVHRPPPPDWSPTRTSNPRPEAA
jgi:glycosyltransferase involved in cell wall biosynthesis